MAFSLEKKILQIGKYFLHLWIILNTNRAFKRRFKEFFDIHPELRKPVEKKIEDEHIRIWKKLSKNINLDTLRLSCNLANNCDPRIVPEEVFATEIQPCLCYKQRKIEYLGSKSFYERWFPGSIFPHTFIHNIDGIFIDNNYQMISGEKTKKILNLLEFPVVVKPNLESFGGKDIFFPDNIDDLLKLIKGKKNFVIQEVIKQHQYFAKYYNNKGINSIRVNLYRSVKDNKVKFLNASLRLGRGHGLDNLTSGGLICSILDNGKLNNYAVDKHGDKYKSHPDTGIAFSDDERIPKYNEMIELAINIGNDFYYSRLMSLDMCFDQKDQWRVIEVNLFDIAIRAAQLGGEPFFGSYTKEIVDYCSKKSITI